MIDANSEKKFLLLKKRLDALHYCQPLTMDSGALVERLLNDLIKTTEGYQNLKKQIDEVNCNLIKTENGLEPLKKENHKLIKENNDLHLAMIKVKEEAEQKDIKWKTTFKSMEGEKRDLKFVSDQKDLKIRKVEEENMQLKQKVDYILTKLYIPSSQKGFDNLPPEYLNENVRANANISLSKKQGFDLSKPIGSEILQEAQSLQQKKMEDYKQWNETLVKQEQLNEKMRNDLKLCEEGKTVLEDRIKYFEMQIKNREQEISRLQSKLDLGSVNVDKLSNEYQISQQIDKVERLNHQIDFLTKENSKLDDEAKSMRKELKRSENMREENRNLQIQLQDMNGKLEQAKFSIQNTDFRQTQSEKQIKDKYEKELQSSNQEVSQLKRQTSQQQQEIQELHEQIEKQLEQIEDLKQKASKSDQLVQAYQCDKKAFTQTLENLRSEKDNTVDRQLSLQEQIENHLQQISELEEENGLQKARIVSLQREMELGNTNFARMQTEVEQLNRAVKEQKAENQQLKQEALANQSQKIELKTELERAQKAREAVQEQLEKVRSEGARCKAEQEQHYAAQDRLQILYEESVKDVESSRKEVKTLEEFLQKSKEQALEAEERAEDLFVQVRAAQEAQKELEKQHRITADLLQQKLKDLRTCEAARSDAERELTELRLYKKKMDQQRKPQPDESQFEAQRLKWQKELDDLRFEVRDRQERIETLSASLEHERAERSSVQAELERIQASQDAQSHNFQRSREREHENVQLVQDVEKVRERERKALSENERLSSQVKKLEAMIQNGTRQVENLNTQREELLREVRALSAEVAGARARVHDEETKCMQAQERANALQATAQEAQDAQKRAEIRAQEAHDELRQSLQELQQLRAQKLEMDGVNRSLKTLAEGLERNREELLQKLQAQAQERLGEDQERRNYGKEVKTLKERVQALEAELAETRQALINVDRERDEMQNQLDSKAEENAHLRESSQNYEIEIQRVKEKALELASKNDAGLHRALELESQLKEAGRRLASFQQEIEDTRYTLSVKERECNELANDLSVVTRENQSLSQELMRVAQERDAQRETISNYVTEEKRSRQTLRAHEMEKTDVLQNYRQVCLENERLEKLNRDAAEETQALFLRLRELEKEGAHLKGVIEHFEGKDQQLIADLEAQERQMSFLNKRLEQAEQACRELADQRDQLLQEIEGMKRVNQGFEMNKDDMRRSIVQLQNEKANIAEKLREQQREIDIKKTQVEYEKQKAQQLEDLLMREREQSHKKQLELSKYQNQDQGDFESNYGAGSSQKKSNVL